MLGRPWFFSSRFKWKNGLQSSHHYWNCHSVSDVQVKRFTDHRCCGVTVWPMSHQDYQYRKENTQASFFFCFFSFLNVAWRHLFIKVMHNLPTWSLYSILELHDIIRLSGSRISIATLAGGSSSSVRSWYRESMTAPCRGGGRKEWGKI